MNNREFSYKRFVLSTSITLVFVYLIVFKVEPASYLRGTLTFQEAFWGATRISTNDLKQLSANFRISWFFISLMIFLTTQLCLALRSHVILKNINSPGESRRISFGVPFWSLHLGFFVNNIVPFHSGDLVRCLVVASKTGLAKSSVIASLALEKILDLCGLLIILGITLIFQPIPDWMRYSAVVLTLMTIVVLAVSITMSFNYNYIESKLNKYLSNRFFIVRKGIHFYLNSLKGLNVLRNRSALWGIALITLFNWLMLSLLMKTMMGMFSINGDFYPALGNAFAAGALLAVVGGIGMALPAAPGGIGTYHGLVAVTLSMFNIPEGTAVMAATGMHAFQYVFVNFLGIIGYWQLKLDLKKR